MIRRIRLIVLAVATFFTVTAGAFLEKTLAFALCGILSFNAATCQGSFGRSIKANAALPPANTASTAIVTDDKKEVAQIRIPGLEIPVPGSGSVDDLLKGIVADQMLKLIASEAPIVSSANNIFPTVSSLPGVPFTPKQRSSVDDHQDTLVAALPGISFASPSLTSLQDIAEIPRIRRQNRETAPTTPADDNAPVQPGNTTDTSRYPFNPTGNVSQIVAQLRQSSDGSVLLEPGDYAIPATLYCMKQRASSPAGHRYLLAPLKGSKADVISALNARAAGSDIPHGKLQALSWNIQAGMKYEEMSSDQQGLVNQLIPGYRDRLSRSFLEQVEAGYNQIAAVSNLPSLDAAINQLGEAGTIIRKYREFRNTLVRYRDNYQALLEELIPGGSSRVVGGAANTPWSKINDQVYARMITKEKVGGTGELQMRVLPSSASNPSPVKVGITNIVADSQNDSIQPLTGSPKQPPEQPQPNSPLPFECNISSLLNQVPVSERAKAEKLYLELLGVVSQLDKYRQSFLRDKNEDFMGLFPAAYYNTTMKELEKIGRGDFQYPIEKMEQMLTFFEAYQVNRLAWDSGRKQSVEPHWIAHFEIANAKTDGYKTCLRYALRSAETMRRDVKYCDKEYLDGVKDVLNSGIDAHVIHDLGRGLKYSLQNTSRSIWGNLKREFDDTKQTLEDSSRATTEQIFRLPKGARLYEEFRGIFVRNSLEKVLEERQKAWEVAIGKRELRPGTVGSRTIDRLNPVQPKLSSMEHRHLEELGKLQCQ